MSTSSLIVWTYAASLFLLLGLLVFNRITFQSLCVSFGRETPRKSWQRAFNLRLKILSPQLFWSGVSIRCLLRSKCPRLDGSESYATVSELLAFLSRFCALPENIAEAQAIAKSLMQLDAILASKLGATELDRIVHGYADSLLHKTIGGFMISKIEFVRSGDLVDRKTMLPVTNGSRVMHALGLVLYSGDTIISKARVLC